MESVERRLASTEAPGARSSASGSRALKIGQNSSPKRQRRQPQPRGEQGDHKRDARSPNQSFEQLAIPLRNQMMAGRSTETGPAAGNSARHRAGVTVSATSSEARIEST